MIPYGFTYKDYNNGSKRTGGRPRARLLTRAVIRRHKKIARRIAKPAIRDELNNDEGDIYA